VARFEKIDCGRLTDAKVLDLSRAWVIMPVPEYPHFMLGWKGWTFDIDRTWKLPPRK
jgi:hypothetical protein